MPRMLFPVILLIFISIFPNVNCTEDVGVYSWNTGGVGYNMNCMLNSWLYFSKVKQWDKFYLFANNFSFKSLDCYSESSGMASKGWDCLFNVPGIINTNVVNEDMEHIPEKFNKKNLQETIFRSRKQIDSILEKTGTDYMESISVLAKNVWDNMTSWARKDVDSVIYSNRVFEESKYIGLHIRRGDKLIKEALLTETKVYLEEAVSYLKNKNVHVSEIKGIWLASDDPTVLYEVQYLSAEYFPDIKIENIEYISAKNTDEVKTQAFEQSYKPFINLLSDFERLSKAFVFVGTYSSNIGRFVTVLRESFGFSRDSSISVDNPPVWFPGGNSNPHGMYHKMYGH